MRKTKYWYKLDNAGKIFPAVSKDSRSNVFRLTFYIEDMVDPSVLEESVNRLLPRFETFAVQLKNGLFWNYFASNTRHFKVEPEPVNLCLYFRAHQNNGYMFKVYYFQNKITLETFHAITDGSGAMDFLKSIVFQYYKLIGHKMDHENKILSELPYSKKESEDHFVANYERDRVKNLREEKAYHLTGEHFANHWTLLFKVKMDTKKLIEMVKTKYQCTMTQYFTALLAMATFKETLDFHSNKKPLKIFVPVNLRPYFDSKTLRNFSLYIKATYPPKLTHLSFEEILAMTKEQFVDQLVKDKLHARISSLVHFEKNLLIRMLPLILKNLAFKIGYNILGESISSFSISNLGLVDLPKALKNKIKDVDFVNTGYGITMTMISIHDKTNILINSPFKDMSIINFMVSHLMHEGLDIVIDTNYQEGYDEIL